MQLSMESKDIDNTDASDQATILFLPFQTEKKKKMYIYQ